MLHSPGKCGELDVSADCRHMKGLTQVAHKR